MSDVTRILSAIDAGDLQAGEKLLPLVYDELRKLAAQRMGAERSGHTLQATALVHEAYLRLVDMAEPQRWSSRGHFFAAAAEAMRRILIDRARRHQRVRHGGGRKRLDIGQLDSTDLELDQGDEGARDRLLALDEALTRLEGEEPEVAAVVKLRYFAGLTIDEAAAVSGLSVRTINRHWAYAKAWLYRNLREQDGANS